MKIGNVVKIEHFYYVVIGSTGNKKTMFGLKSEIVAENNLNFDKIIMLLLNLTKTSEGMEYKPIRKYVTCDKDKVLNGEFKTFIKFFDKNFKSHIDDFFKEDIIEI